MKRVQQQEVLQYCVEQQLAFAIYKYPEEEDIQLLVSQTAREETMESIDFDKHNAFVIAPFSSNEDQVLFLNADFLVDKEMEPDKFEEIKLLSGVVEIDAEEKNHIADYSDYEQQFAQLMKNIEGGMVEKAILSRVKLNNQLQKKHAAQFFYQLTQSYPSVYTFMFYAPQSGLWAGASPELLLEVTNEKATTVSLAGTRQGNEMDNKWGNKEIEEQQIVTDFVGELLSKEGIENYSKEGPYTVNAGKMVHLKTIYSFSSRYLKNRLSYFIEQLYPTPAVCGVPKAEAMKAILQIEKHQRTYYAGFVGRIDQNNIKLFVNIRSLKFISEGVHLYLGGGITAGSDVQMEWTETELKAQTMLNVIEKCVAL